MRTFSTICILCMGTLSVLLMTEKFDIKFLRLFAKITGKGGRGGLVFFHEVRKVLGCHMPNFRSLGQSLHIDNICKNEGVGEKGQGAR